MNRTIKIKAGNISNLTDARYFAAAMVEWMGFNFSKTNENGLSIEDAKTIKNWIVGPKLIAEFDAIDYDFIFQVSENLETKSIQLNTNEAFQNQNNYELIENSLIVKSLAEAEKVLDENPFAILQIDGNIDLAKEIIEKTNVSAIEIQGSAEEQTGLKSYDEINELFEFLEQKAYI